MISVIIWGIGDEENDRLIQNQKGGIMPDSEGKPEKFSWITNKAFLSAFGALFALVFIALSILINVATQVEDIDEKLKYIPAQPKGYEIPEESVVAGQTIYVPVYSHIYSQGGRPFLLETTLSVRNSDPDKNITIRSVRYYDTNGKLIKKYLDKPLQLKPLATAEFLVKQEKIEGGSGANFIVEWVADTKVNKPIIEAVMIGIEGQTSISFARPGIAIEN